MLPGEFTGVPMANVSVSIVDPNHFLDDVPLLEPTVRAAVAYLDTLVVFKGTLDIQIRVESTPTGRFAANGDNSYVGVQDGLKTWEASMLAESRNGIDPHPQTPDFTILIDPSSDYLSLLWWDPAIATTLAANPPNNKTDAFSVLLHELLHGMGVSGWRNRETGLIPADYQSVWDSLVTVTDGRASFMGSSVIDLIGGPLEVRVGGSQSMTHLGDGPNVGASDMPWVLASNLNSYSFKDGERYTLGLLERAILQDLGWTLKDTNMVDVVNRWDDQPTELFMVGWNTAEQFQGGELNDRIEGRGGNDTLVGGGGNDTALWDMAASSYTLSFAGDTLVVSDKGFADGNDTLSSVEALQFADKTVIVESQAHDSYADLPVELYHFFIVAFNGAPGVQYMNQLAEAYRYGLSVKQIVDIFTTKTQFTDVYPTSLSHPALATELVNQIVKNSADASAKAAGIANITEALDYGLSVGEVIYNVFGNLATLPKTDPAWNAVWGNTARQFDNEIAVAKVYTEVLNQSTTDLDTLRDVLASVDAYTDVSSQEVIITLIGQALLQG